MKQLLVIQNPIYICHTYHKKSISNLQPPIFLCSSSINNLGDINAVVPRDVLVSHSSCNTETQTWRRYEKQNIISTWITLSKSVIV